MESSKSGIAIVAVVGSLVIGLMGAALYGTIQAITSGHVVAGIVGAAALLGAVYSSCPREG